MIKFLLNTCKNLFNKNNIVIVFLFIFFTSCKPEITLPDLPDPYEAGWKGKKVCEILEDTPKQRILKCTFPPGVGHEKHYHKPHFGYTITGGKFKITNTDGVREVNVPTGSDFSNDIISTHQVVNIGDTTAVFLIIEPK